MALSSGSRLGPYEIVAPLGAGGMGEVYHARDTKLGREVALKILPDVFASDPDRLARFSREAQTLASLNHPHIAQVYGVEEQAEASGSSRAIIMELVEGETLAERIAQGALALDDALAIARQIAEALQAAHDTGIVHRDLKPANIKLRPDGTVKVLDFGLARADRTSGAGTIDALNSPTLTSPAMTAAGLILGTAAYMAPEQAKGRVVDKRADVWAFGCVLFEMLTARRAFEGDDVSDTLAAVLRGAPDWSALPSDMPPVLTALIRRCLERDAGRRVADVSAIRFVLEEPALLSPPATSTPPVDPVLLQPQVDTAVANARRRLVMRGVVPLVAALVIALALAGVALWRAVPGDQGAAPVRFVIESLDGHLISLVRASIAISPDGSQVVYIANGQLNVRELSDFHPRAIPATGLGQNVTAPAFSPDGEWIAFHSASERAIKRVSVRGGPALRVCEANPPLGIEWNVSGILIAGGADGVARCNAAGGAPQSLADVAEGESAAGATLLPDGDTLLFSVVKNADGASRWDKAQIVAHSLRTGTRRTIVSNAVDPRFTSSGHLLYANSGILFAAPFDPATQTLTGEALPVIEGIRRGGGVTQLAVAHNGTIAYVPGPTGSASGTRGLALADRAATVARLPIPEGHYTHVRASRDGTALAVATDDSTQGIVWIYRMDGSAALQRLTLEGRNSYPIWSPDGTFVAFASDRGGESGIYRQRANGTGDAERLTSAAEEEVHIPESWSPDGRHLAYAVQKDDVYSLHILTLATGRSDSFAGVRSLDPIGSTFSPDGKWIAYTMTLSSDLSAPDRGVFVRPFPVTGSVYQAPRQIIDFHAVWTPDGRELVYVPSASSGQMLAVRANAGAGFTFGAPMRFPAAVTGERLSGEPRAFDIMPDGRFVGVITAGEDQNRATLTEIRVVLNWLDDLRARVK